MSKTTKLEKKIRKILNEQFGDYIENYFYSEGCKRSDIRECKREELEIISKLIIAEVNKSVYIYRVLPYNKVSKH